jgi:uncharacterized protein with von Willebrand factor type A (vWA) domain
MYTRIQPEELVHNTTKLETTYWGSVLNNSKNIQSALNRRVDKVTGGDIFQALYQWNPTIKEDNTDPALAAWLTRTIATNEFKQLRSTTVGDREVAAAASVTLFRELMRANESTFKAVLQTKHSLDQMEIMMDASLSETVLSTIKDAQRQLAENIQSPAGLDIQEPSEISNPTTNGLRQDTNAVSLALTHTDETIEMAQDLAAFDATNTRGHSIGGSASGQILDTLDSHLMEQITKGDSLRKIFQIAGRMRVILQQAKSRKPQQAPTPVSIAVGNDLSNVISSELGALSDVTTEDKFFSRYLDRSLLQYDHKSRVNEGLGPFICCIDMSGSMHGQPLQIAQALFVSLAQMAVEKKRKIVFIPFASYTVGNYEITSSAGLVKTLTSKYSVGGGTMFTHPLDDATQIIKLAKEANDNYKNADVILITDGDSSLNDSWIVQYMADKKDLGFRLLGLNVRGRGWRSEQLPMFDAVAHMENGSLSSLDWLHNFSDSLV